jgi:hypothetical protein
MPRYQQVVDDSEEALQNVPHLKNALERCATHLFNIVVMHQFHDPLFRQFENVMQELLQRINAAEQQYVREVFDLDPIPNQVINPRSNN